MIILNVGEDVGFHLNDVQQAKGWKTIQETQLLLCGGWEGIRKWNEETLKDVYFLHFDGSQRDGGITSVKTP